METAEARPADARPLWRRIADFPLIAMLIAAAVYLLALMVGTMLGGLLPRVGVETTTAVHVAIDIAVVLAAYKLVIVRLGDRPRDDLPARNALKYLGLGLLAGVLIMGAIVGVAALANVYRIVGGGDTSNLVVELMGTAILPGFMEELMFRGILFRWIEEFGGSWLALLLSSALFGFAHIWNPGSGVIATSFVAVEAGVLLGGAYMLTRNLWLPMGLHAAWNFTQGEIFDVPVSGLDEHGLIQAKLSGPALLSGGGFGLEASLIALSVATIAGVWLVALAVRRGELVQPWWVRRKGIRSS
jgi:membrane protease YdiL (CAAX protease family)